jgi:hypothetical protein
VKYPYCTSGIHEKFQALNQIIDLPVVFNRERLPIAREFQNHSIKSQKLVSPLRQIPKN